MKTEKEIEDMLELAAQCPDFLGMSYQDGVQAALEWVIEYTEEAPYNEEDK